MTYCLGVKVKEGLFFASDSRTNAGVDSVATFHKLFVFQQPGERLIVVMTAGNLAATQEVISRLQQGRTTDDPARNLFLAPTLFDAAAMVGALLRIVIDRDRGYLKAFGGDVSSSFIVGGQIKGDEPRLFMVYPAGNFIESEPATPYFQLGETKYGKPILERMLTAEASLAKVAKCALLSFDATIRANLSVAPPIDVLLYQTDSLLIGSQHEIKDDDQYFADLSAAWGDGILALVAQVPDPPWAVIERPPPAAASTPASPPTPSLR
jgi:putative proteasome-type protease